MSCWSVNLFDFGWEKLHQRFSTSAVFAAQNRTNQQTNKTYFALIMHLLSIRATTSWKMLMNNKFKVLTSTGNPSGNSHSHILTSHAINMSCSFSQSVRSIESKCVVMQHILMIDIFSISSEITHRQILLYWLWVNIGSGNGLVPLGTKPLS